VSAPPIIWCRECEKFAVLHGSRWEAYGGTFTRRQAADLNVDIGMCTLCYRAESPGFRHKTSKQTSEPDIDIIHEDTTPWKVGE